MPPRRQETGVRDQGSDPMAKQSVVLWARTLYVSFVIGEFDAT